MIIETIIILALSFFAVGICWARDVSRINRAFLGELREQEADLKSRLLNALIRTCASFWDAAGLEEIDREFGCWSNFRFNISLIENYIDSDENGAVIHNIALSLISIMREAEAVYRSPLIGSPGELVILCDAVFELECGLASLQYKFKNILK